MLKEGDKTPAVIGVSYDGASFDLGAPGRHRPLLLPQGQHRWLNDRSR